MESRSSRRVESSQRPISRLAIRWTGFRFFANELKADLARRLKELKTSESMGSFYAQMTMLDQTLVNYMDLADTPEK